MSLSLGLRSGAADDRTRSETSDPSIDVSDAVGRPAGALDSEGLRLRPLSMRYLDEALEARYQQKSGAESLTGFRITTGAAAAIWLLAAVVIPTGTSIPFERAVVACFVVGFLNWGAFVMSDRLDTLDRQHATLSFLTSVNGLVILWLAATGGVLPGYGISAIMLLFAFGFVSRTGFAFAALRTGVIVVGYVLAAAMYRGRGSLLVDDLIFGAAVGGTLVALRLLERSRRLVFYQDVVITEQAAALRVEMDRADGLLRNLLPGAIASRLLDGERTIADEYPAVSVLFADIVGFTPLAARLPAADVVARLDRLFARFDELVAERGLEKIKTIGDAYMAAGGLPDSLADHAVRVVDLGLAMIDVAAQESDGTANLRLRVGVHSGPVVGGVIGDRKLAFDIWGETVNIASRLEAQGVPGRVHVSAATWQDIKDEFDGEPAGPTRLRGYGPMETFTVGRHRMSSEHPGRTVPPG